MDKTTEPLVRDYTEIFSVMKYPAGEFHVAIKAGAPDSHYENTSAVIWPARDYNDLSLILLAWETYRRFMGESLTVVVPYFPFARHDRRNSARDSNPLQFAIRLMQPMIDAGDLIIMDPHSDVSGVIPHISQGTIVRHMYSDGLFDQHATVLVPDAGATKKAMTWLPHVNAAWIQGLKKRNPTDGSLSGFGVQPGGRGTVIKANDPIVIVDDICDGGGTFLGLMGVIEKDMWAGPARLAVTHGLFTKGTDALFDTFDEIWTLDMYKHIADASNPGMHYIDTKALIAKAIDTGQIQ